MMYGRQSSPGGNPNFQEVQGQQSPPIYANPNQPQQPLPNFQQQQPLNQLNQGQTSPQPHNEYHNAAQQPNNTQQTPGAVPMNPNVTPLPGGAGQQMQHPWQQSMNQAQHFSNQIGVMQNNPFFQNKMRKFPGFQQGMQGQGQGDQSNSGGMPQNAGQQPLWGQSPTNYAGNNLTTNV